MLISPEVNTEGITFLWSMIRMNSLSHTQSRGDDEFFGKSSCLLCLLVLSKTPHSECLFIVCISEVSRVSPYPRI